MLGLTFGPPPGFVARRTPDGAVWRRADLDPAAVEALIARFRAGGPGLREIKRDVRVSVYGGLALAGAGACLKVYASRRLNGMGLDEPNRKRWARHGSTRWLWKPEHIPAAVQYVMAEQGDAIRRSNRRSLSAWAATAACAPVPRQPGPPLPNGRGSDWNIYWWVGGGIHD